MHIFIVKCRTNTMFSDLTALSSSLFRNSWALLNIKTLLLVLFNSNTSVQELFLQHLNCLKMRWLTGTSKQKRSFSRGFWCVFFFFYLDAGQRQLGQLNPQSWSCVDLQCISVLTTDHYPADSQTDWLSWCLVPHNCHLSFITTLTT